MQSLTIRTHQECWVIPAHFEMVKLMISKKQLCVDDLRFASDRECQYLTKKLALMALEDECRYRKPSIIGELCRNLVARSEQLVFSQPNKKRPHSLSTN